MGSSARLGGLGVGDFPSKDRNRRELGEPESASRLVAPSIHISFALHRSQLAH